MVILHKSWITRILKTKTNKKATGAERHAIRTGHQNFAESTEAIKPLSEEEKKQKLAELKTRMAEKRAAREQAEIAERKQAEKIRRKAGQEVTNIKEALEAKEIKKIYDMKKKEKELEKVAKAKIMAQIEQDKKERAARKEAKQNVQQAQAQADALAAAQPVVKKDYNEARLQVKKKNDGENVCDIYVVYRFVCLVLQPSLIHLMLQQLYPMYTHFCKVKVYLTPLHCPLPFLERHLDLRTKQKHWRN